jgi:hypothetical protein
LRIVLSTEVWWRLAIAFSYATFICTSQNYGKTVITCKLFERLIPTDCCSRKSPRRTALTHQKCIAIFDGNRILFPCVEILSMNILLSYRMKSPQSQRRVKTILRLLYKPRPFQRYQLCEDWSVGTQCFGATKGRRQNEKYSYID